MIKRLQKNASKGKVPVTGTQETSETQLPIKRGLVSGRSAGILGASLVIAICAGALTYLAVGRPGANLAGAILAGGAAFGSAVCFLDSIIAA